MNKEFSAQEIDFGFYLAGEVFNGAVFGERLDISKISHNRGTMLFYEVYKHTAAALRPLAKFQPQLVTHILDKTILKSVAFISGIAYELLLETEEFPALDKAGAAMALVQIADHLMDRGDTKMVIALESFFSGQSNPDEEIQARIAILKAIASLSYETSQDEGDFIADAMLAILRDELAVYQISKRYAQIDNKVEQDAFFKRYACNIANLSIRNGGLRPGTYMVYSAYRLAHPELPALKELIYNESIQELSYFGEWAIRLWDDFGDQEIDAGQGIYTNSYIINPYVEQNEKLSLAYFEAVRDDGECFNFMNAMRRNNSSITKLVALYLRAVSERMPQAVECQHETYLAILRRIIEAGFVNTLGDEGISYSQEIIADYS